MGLRSRILRLVHPDNGGPRKRNVLEALARGKEDSRTTFKRLLASGDLVMYGDHRGATYGQPGYRKPRRNTA